jgi:hypothetical protein
MQDGHPVAFKSRKLQDREQRYLVHEKEMTVVVHCLQVWRHYLLGRPFVVKTDNVVTSYFATQPKLSPKQVCWQDFLVEFDMTIEYRSGKLNVVVDALSRKAQLVTLEEDKSPTTMDGSQIHVLAELRENIKEGLQVDPTTKSIMKQVEEGRQGGSFFVTMLLYFCGASTFLSQVIFARIS